MPDHINAGERLERGQSIVSNNGKFKLYLRRDGRVKLYRYEPGNLRTMGRISNYDVGDTGFLWVTPRGYLFGGREVRSRYYGWSRPRNGLGPDYSGARMFVQDDGNVVIYDERREVIWSTGTYGAHPKAYNPANRVITISNGSLAINSSRANTLFENPHERVTLFDSEHAVTLDRGNPQAIIAPQGPGTLAIQAADYSYDEDTGAADAVAYRPGTVANRSGNTWTMCACGTWLTSSEEIIRPETTQPSTEELDWVDSGWTSEDESRLSNDAAPRDDIQ